MRSIEMTILAWTAAVMAAGAALADPLSTAFTYQGRLEQNGVPYQGTIASLRFLLYDSPTGSNTVGGFISANVPVQDGVFTTEVDFGAAALNGDERWVEIIVDSQTLSPRQRLAGAPYSLQTRGLHVDDALNVGVGTNAPQARLHVEAPGGGDGSVILPPGAVSAAEIVDEPGQARSAVSELIYLTNGTDTPMVFAGIYCPADGFVLAMAEAEFVTGIEAGQLSEVQFDIRPVGSAATPARRFRISSSIGHQVRQSCIRVFPVQEGQQTFEFFGRSANSAAAAGRAWNPELTLVFLPTQY